MMIKINWYEYNIKLIVLYEILVGDDNVVRMVIYMILICFFIES